MSMDIAALAQVWAGLMVLNVLVAAVAWSVARSRDRSPGLVAFCAVLLGFVPPLNVVYLAVLSLLPARPGH